MRDHNISYGSNKADISPPHLSLLSQQVRGFLDKHSDLLHAEADVAWLLGQSDIRHSLGSHNTDAADEVQMSNPDAVETGNGEFDRN